ncbi:MAG: dihydrodipicolinate synthase family protein, partial [Acetobacteraceae bacterium]|nr:dihydrodipicolinate synthase family protein [Acetobacteraceae bacterium]
VARLRQRYPDVVRGVKDSSGDFANTRAYVDAFARDGFEVYCGDDSALSDLLAIGGAGCITAAANVGCSTSARVYGGETQAQTALSAIRRTVTSEPLIPALRALVARNTGDAAWHNIRPPHVRLSAEACARLYAAFDAIGAPIAQAA